jgi:hypothetical protein
MTKKHNVIKIYGDTIVGTTAPEEGDIVLVNVNGWNTIPTLNRNVSQRLFNDGEFQSTAAHYGAKFLSFDFYFEQKEDLSLIELRNKLMLLAEKRNDLVLIENIYYEDGVEVLKETLSARPDTDFLQSWEENGNIVFFTINYTAPSPYKTIYENGSTTPDVDKRL